MNPAAWTDAAPGEFGTSAPYYNSYRWQRQPPESLALGRIFAINREREIRLAIRAEFANVFNRVFYSQPSAINPASPVATGNPFANGQPGALSAGFGFVNTLNGTGTSPRTGQLIARFTF